MHGTLAKLQIEPEVRDRPSRETAEEAVRTLIRWPAKTRNGKVSPRRLPG